MMRITETVKQLLIINIIFFIGTMLVPQAFPYLALYFPENPNFHFWQPLTHMFMHGGFMHIFFNMFALYSFGVVLEQVWGAKKFIFFYISCGLGAALLHIGVNYISFYSGMNILLEHGIPKAEILETLAQGKFNTQWSELMSATQLENFLQAYLTPSVGASGAIYGVLVAFAFMLPNAELMLMFVPIPIKAKYFVPGLLAVDLFLGLKGGSIFGGGDGIAHFAHIGGALVGFLMMWFWKKDQFNKNRWN
jgi:membrane associated rhomboid family serine protease